MGEAQNSPGIGTYIIDYHNHTRNRKANAAFKSKVNRFDHHT
jgi:hypothetical protein